MKIKKIVQVNKPINQVQFFWNKECHNTDEIELLPPRTINQCKVNCNNNEFIDYDYNNQKLSCRQCPFGTYSSINSTTIIWNKESILEFINKCELNKNDHISNQCEGFKLINQTVKAGGETLVKDSIYSYQLIYNTELKTDGKVNIVNYF